MGSGRTELVTTIFGEYGKITGGTIKLEGQEIHISDRATPCTTASAWCPRIARARGWY